MIADCSHWIFDLDGTLTVAVHDFAAIRRELEVPDTSDILGHLMSLPTHIANQLQIRLRKIEFELSSKTQAAEGAHALLHQLQEYGVQLGVLTRNTHENALRTLELIGLDRFFSPSKILGRDEALPKPDPDGILRLAKIWRVDPSATVMVGDYLYDLQAGRAAGAMTVYVDTNRSFRWPELSDITVETLQDLKELYLNRAINVYELKYTGSVTTVRS